MTSRRMPYRDSVFINCPSAKVHLTPEHLAFTDFYQLMLEWLSATR